MWLLWMFGRWSWYVLVAAVDVWEVALVAAVDVWEVALVALWVAVSVWEVVLVALGVFDHRAAAGFAGAAGDAAGPGGGGDLVCRHAEVFDPAWPRFC